MPFYVPSLSDMIVLFVDNLFLYSGGQSVSCKASLAALRLYGYFCDIVVMILSENKYMMMMILNNHLLTASRKCQTNQYFANLT